LHRPRFIALKSELAARLLSPGFRLENEHSRVRWKLIVLYAFVMLPRLLTICLMGHLAAHRATDPTPALLLARQDFSIVIHGQLSPRLLGVCHIEGIVKSLYIYFLVAWFLSQRGTQRLRVGTPRAHA